MFEEFSNIAFIKKFQEIFLLLLEILEDKYMISNLNIILELNPFAVKVRDYISNILEPISNIGRVMLDLVFCL